MQKKKPSENFQEKRQTPKRKKIDPTTIVNETYKGVRICLLGNAEKAAWDVMDRKEKRNHVKNVEMALAQGKFKTLDVTFDYKGMPVTKMIYVPIRYSGNGRELLDIQDENIQA